MNESWTVDHPEFFTPIIIVGCSVFTLFLNVRNLVSIDDGYVYTLTIERTVLSFQLTKSTLVDSLTPVTKKIKNKKSE